MKITIKEVAKAAGVSVATVSRVLNDSSNVKASTINTVNKVIKNLNYSPNHLGRNLRKCETNLILVTIPTAEQDFYSEIIKGMQITANSLGYDIITNICPIPTQNNTKQLKMLYNRTVDAVIMLAAKIPANELNELSSQYNIALCCEDIEGSNVLTVKVDDEKAGFDATEVLIKKQHKKIGLIRPYYNIKSSIDREKGYKKALQKHNININNNYIYLSDYSYKTGEDAMEYFLNLPDPPTAIFAITDILAIGACKKAIEKGLEVGKDISILGFDNIMISKIYSPSISTIAQPGYDIGKKVVERLIHNITSEIPDNSHYFFEHKIILRQSTGD